MGVIGNTLACYGEHEHFFVLFVYRFALGGFGGGFFGGLGRVLGLIFGFVKWKEKSSFENASAVSRVAFLVAFVAVRFV